MTGRAAALVFALCYLASCSSDERADSPTGAGGEPPSMNDGGATGGAGGGAAGTTGIGGMSITGGVGEAPSGGSGGDASIAEPDGDSGAHDAGADASTEVPALASEPCSEALDAQPGVITLDVGDSASSATPRAFEGELSDDGPYEVLEVSATIPNPDAEREALSSTFYVPDLTATERVPLVLVMHGFGLTHVEYAHFSRHFASHGLIALGLSLPASLTAAHDKNAAEAIAAIDFALSDSAPAEVRGHIDPDRIAAAGHSLGGKIAFYAAALDPRIDIVIGWDPSNAGGPPCFIDPNACNDFVVAPNCLAMDSGLVHLLHAESLVFRAAADGANPEPAHNAIHFHRGAPAPATLLDFDDNVLHGDFADPNAAVIAHTRRVQLALVLDRFFGVTGVEAYLPMGASIGSEPLLERVLSR